MGAVTITLKSAGLRDAYLSRKFSMLYRDAYLSCKDSMLYNKRKQLCSFCSRKGRKASAPRKQQAAPQIYCFSSPTRPRNLPGRFCNSITTMSANRSQFVSSFESKTTSRLRNPRVSAHIITRVPSGPRICLFMHATLSVCRRRYVRSVCGGRVRAIARLPGRR